MTYCYDKYQLPLLTPTKLVLFAKVHIKQVSRPSTPIQVNEYNVPHPRSEEGKVDMEGSVYDTTNQTERATIKYEQEGRFCLGVARAESKEDGTMKGKRCPVFDYTGKKIFTINTFKKEIRHEFSRLGKLTLPSSPWVEKIKTDKIWLYEYVGKIKGIGKQGEKVNEMNIHTIADLQRYVR